MAATITFDTGTVITPSVTNLTFLKTPLEAIGLVAANLVKDTTTELIYKITKGTGTYADTYLRFFTQSSSTIVLQMGTGYDSTNQVITGAGTSRRIAYSTQYSCYVRSILTSDNTLGLLQFVRTDNSQIHFQIGYTQPTNTALTAGTVPLTAGLINTGTQSSTFYNTSSALYGWRFSYNEPALYENGAGGSNLYLSNDGLGYLETNRRYGTRDYYMLGCSGEYISGTTGTPGYNTVEPIPFAVGYGLQFSEGSSQGIIPNVPIFSGGRVIGYNSNLAYCSPTIAIGDRIIVTPSTEEYIKIDGHGVAVRQV